MATNWVFGSKNIPIKLASTYWATERNATMTPDEGLIDTMTHSKEWLRRQGIGIEGNITGLSMLHSFVGGEHIEFIGGSRYADDGLILSLCNERSKFIMKKLRKTACVKILDVELLKTIVDSQITTVGIMRSCEYTGSHNRNHFLKSCADSWQCEFRMFWQGISNIAVSIPAGLAEPVTF